MFDVVGLKNHNEIDILIVKGVALLLRPFLYIKKTYKVPVSNVFNISVACLSVQYRYCYLLKSCSVQLLVNLNGK